MRDLRNRVVHPQFTGRGRLLHMFDKSSYGWGQSAVTRVNNVDLDSGERPLREQPYEAPCLYIRCG
jgi:hypothetical protein